jgi:hypothetical protein
MIVINIFLAVLFFFLGYLVKYKQMDFLIAGYNQLSQEDKENYYKDKMCNVVGNFLFHIAFIMVIMALFLFFSVFNKGIVIIVGWVAISIYILGFVIYLNTGDRLLKS